MEFEEPHIHSEYPAPSRGRKGGDPVLPRNPIVKIGALARLPGETHVTVNQTEKVEANCGNGSSREGSESPWGWDVVR